MNWPRRRYEFLATAHRLIVLFEDGFNVLKFPPHSADISLCAGVCRAVRHELARNAK